MKNSNVYDKSMQGSMRTGPVRIHCRNGRMIDIDAGLPAELLHSLIAVVERA